MHTSESIIRLRSGEKPFLLHGADYNPDQWLGGPDVLSADVELMKAAGINVVSIGIFAWAAIEPEEGRFQFDWMDETIDRLWNAGISVFLATPTGARPAWMSAAYPEVLRVAPNRTRNLHGVRHNHCFTSPVYRDKTHTINSELARRYSSHPAVRLWHLSNEYHGECHCDLCREAFGRWLKERYDNDLNKVNDAWWAHFWGHTFTDWEQIEPPAPHGEPHLHGLNLDWKRFTTHQTRDFMRAEIEAVRAVDQTIPVTTNLMGFFPEIDYFKLCEDIDVVSWDSYPHWGYTDSDSGSGLPMDDSRRADAVAAGHDLMRSCGRGRPFLLMESTPSMTNWMPFGRKKRPGMHLASSMLAVAHGSDSVQYFQWRKSRGSVEKFHGAVVDHVGHRHTRVFEEVTRVGTTLELLPEIAGTRYPADSAVIFDWENMWAMEDSQGPLNDGRLRYYETVLRHHRALCRLAVQCDVIDSEQSFESYKLLVAPMLYMVKPGVAARIERFVQAGGTFVATYWSGIVNETDLCFTTGFPGPLAAVLGIWAEEIDALRPDERNTVVAGPGLLPDGHRYEARDLCDLIHLRGATALAAYGEDFYAGRPALTLNRHGTGSAYYVASRNDDAFLADLYSRIVDECRPLRVYSDSLPQSVHAALRVGTNNGGSAPEYRFLINFADQPHVVPAAGPNETVIFCSPDSADESELPGYGVQVRRR